MDIEDYEVEGQMNVEEWLWSVGYYMNLPENNIEELTMIKSCKDCTERYIGCHSVCEKYLSEKAKNDKHKAEIRIIKNQMSIADSVKTDGIKRMKRGKRK